MSRPLRLMIAATVAGACAAAIGVYTLTTAHAASSGDLDWQPCQDGSGRAECATFTVPVDWNAPDGATTKISLARVPAADPDNNAGRLLLNFGAGNSTRILDEQPVPALDQLTENFEVITFDPRGLGREEHDTLPLCDESPAGYRGLVLAEDEQDWEEHAARNSTYQDSCREALGDEYQGLNSWQVAHDMDALREALGEEQLNYVGNSYGTAYGQAYAELFTDRVQRMYLDGIADHTQSELEDWLTNYALTQEEQFQRFVSWCAERDDCALDDDAAEAWDDLAAQVEQQPLPAPGAGEGETVDAGEFHAGTHFAMNPHSWGDLATAMDKARDGDAADFLTVLIEPPSEEEEEEDKASVQSALQCHDFMPTTPGYDETMAMTARIDEVAPRVGSAAALAELGRCVGISGGPSFEPHPFEADGLPPVLVGIGDLDNNTPHHGAEHMAAQLPDGAKVRHGDGHAAFLHGAECLGGHVMDYLKDGTLPPEDTYCPGELLD